MLNLLRKSERGRCASFGYRRRSGVVPKPPSKTCSAVALSFSSRHSGSVEGQASWLSVLFKNLGRTRSSCYAPTMPLAAQVLSWRSCNYQTGSHRTAPNDRKRSKATLTTWRKTMAEKITVHVARYGDR